MESVAPLSLLVAKIRISTRLAMGAGYGTCARGAYREEAATAVGGTPYCRLKAAEKCDWFLKPTIT